MNGRFYDITPNGMMLDVSVSPKKKKRCGYKLEWKDTFLNNNEL
jgi:hypothetical protein